MDDGLDITAGIIILAIVGFIIYEIVQGVNATNNLLNSTGGEIAVGAGGLGLLGLGAFLLL